MNFDSVKIHTIHKAMGLTYARFKVKKSREATQAIDVKFLIDSGVVYSLVPATDLARIGIAPHRTLTFVLADGTELQRQVGDAYFERNGQGGAAPVIFGEPGDEPLLGATTLESLALILDPFKRELRPMSRLPLM